MAKPIKETPILNGKDAERFIKEQSSPRERSVVLKEKERILKNYNLFKEAERINRHIPA